MRKNFAAFAAVLALSCPAFATVLGNPPPAVYSCNGTTTSYTVPFPYLATADLIVTRNTGGTLTTLAFTTDYTVSPSLAPSTGTLKLTAGSKCPSGSTLTISRNVALTQPTSTRTGAYRGEVHEQIHDRTEMQIQQGATTHATDKAAAAAKDIAQDAATVGVSNSVAALNSSSQAVTSASSVLAFGSSTPRTLTSRFSDVVNVKDYGATGDGSTDDTAAIQAAITAGGGKTIWFPVPGVSYKMAGTVTITVAGTRLVGGYSKIFMAFTSGGPTGGILFDVTASNVEFDGIWIDSTGSTNSPLATINHYAIRAHGTSGTHITNLRVRDCMFTALPWNDTYGAVVATHAIYVQWADNVSVQDNRFNAPSGAAVFFSGVTSGYVINNRINDTGWYSVNFNDLVSNSRISGNSITGTTSGIRVWGGSINLMSSSSTGTACGTPGCATIRNVEVDHNYISGVHSYTGAMHIESCSHVSVHNNFLENITLTTGSPFYPDTNQAVYIRPYVRPGSAANTNEGPSDHIDISNNTLIAGAVGTSIGQIAIYADAQSNGGALAYSDTLTIKGNRVQSVDATHYFADGIIVHGQQGGWKNVSISSNEVTGFAPSGTPVDGIIGIVGLTTAPVLDTLISDNQVVMVGGTSTTSFQLGMGVGAFTTRTRVSGNSVRGFWNGIRTFANATSVYVGQNVFDGNVNANYVLGVPFTNRATITLAAGTGTATVQQNVQCTCTDTTAAAAVKCAVSGTTLTATGTGTDVIAFNCL